VKRMMMRYRTREQSSISAFRRDDDGAPQQRFARSDDPVTHRRKPLSLSKLFGGERELLKNEVAKKKSKNLGLQTPIFFDLLSKPRNSHVNTQEEIIQSETKKKINFRHNKE